MSPNTSLLAAKNASPSDRTPAPLTGPSSAVQFAFQGLQPPSNLYINVDDQLVISGATSQSAETITVNVRLLMPNGRLEDMQFFIKPGNTRTVLKQSFPLAEGFLLSMSASAAVAKTRGQTYVRVSLQRSAGGAGQPAYCLMADYVTTQSVPGYPNGRVLSPSEGPGNVYTFPVSNPGAGADWIQTVPVNARWRVRSWTALLTTSASAGNRNVQSVLNVSLGTSFQLPAAVSIPASTSAVVTASGLSPYTGALTTSVAVPLPPDCVLSGVSGSLMQLGTITAGLLAGDQWSAINLLIEEWLDNV